MIVGHTHRVSNLMVGNILVTEGINAGASYSVLQLMVKGGDVEWAGGATRVAKNHRRHARAPTSRPSSTRRTPRPPSCATRSSARRRTTSSATSTRLHESAMGNLVADAMRAKYPGVEAAYTNSGGLRQDIVGSPPSAGEAVARSPGARCSPSCRSATGPSSRRSPAPR